MAQPRYIVVGGGLAGLSATMRLAELGCPVDLFAMCPVKRSHSVCAQGGINGAVNTMGEGDSPWLHFLDTAKGGDYLNNQAPIKGMCDDAPAIIYLLDRMGVMFNRTSEGFIEFRRFGGTLHHRTAFAGATTGQQMMYALDEQVRRYEHEGLVRKFESWEFLEAVLDDQGRCRGIVAQNMRDMRIEAFPAAAVLIATGGPGLIFGRTTNSMLNTGYAAAAVYRQGALYANGEFIQVHPTAIPGEDKLRLMSESARGEGGRVWVPRTAGDKRAPGDIPEADRLYFLEEKYPQYGNLVPRDIASREIFDIYQKGLGIGGAPMVYLDLTHKPAEWLDVKLGGILEIYEKFIGADPRHEPMLIFPAVHYSMGGLWVDFERDAKTGGIVPGHPRNQRTNIPGLYAAGEVDYQFHGANRLGANSLLSCLWAGLQVAPSMKNAAAEAGGDVPASLLEAARKRQEVAYDLLRGMSGNENPFGLHRQLGERMNDACGIVRDNAELRKLLGELHEFKARARQCDPLDTSANANLALPFIRQLQAMLDLAEVIVLSAIARDECRGAHYKPAADHPQPDKNEPVDSPAWDKFHAHSESRDAEWLRTTLAKHSPSGPQLSYEPVDISLVSPQPRDYTGQGKKAHKAWLKERRQRYYESRGEPPPVPWGQRATGKKDETGAELFAIDPDWRSLTADKKGGSR